MYQYLKESPVAPLLIKAQNAVFSSHLGENSTLFKGLGSDFVELREYSTGDDIKHIDWIISSKLDKPYVKLFHEQKEINITLISLLNASLNFGVNKLKFDTLKETLAILAFSCIKQHNAYSAYTYNKNIIESLKKSRHIFGVRELIETLHYSTLLKKEINYKNLATTFNKNITEPSLIFLLGDFFNTQELQLNALSQRHELVVLIIRDRFEENPIALDELNITDPQSGRSARVNLNKKATLKIKTKLLQDDTLFINKLNTHGIKHLKIYTDEDPLKKLLLFMERF